jgi:hypothetical protein
MEGRAVTAVRGETPLAGDGWRFYRLGRMVGVAVILGPGYGTVCVLVWVLAYFVDHHGSVLGLIAGLVVIGGAFAGIWWQCMRTGVRETDGGLVAVSGFGSSTVSWDEIEAFDVPGRQPLNWNRVVVRCRSGRSVLLPLAQAKRITWHHDETLDIVSVLTQRVNEVRRTHGLEPLTEAARLPAAWAGSHAPPPRRLPNEATITRLRRKRREAAMRDRSSD